MDPNAARFDDPKFAIYRPAFGQGQKVLKSTMNLREGCGACKLENDYARARTRRETRNVPEVTIKRNQNTTLIETCSIDAIVCRTP
jgi:hypothetical protein